jgi:hypothetical protein
MIALQNGMDLLRAGRRMSLLLERLEGRLLLSAPVIQSLTDSPDPVNPGATLTLTANNVTDADGDTIVQVRFWRSGNAIFGDADDVLLGNGSKIGVTNDWRWTGAATWGPGTTYYFARATDSRSEVSNPQMASGLVNDNPVVASLTGSPVPISRNEWLTLTANGVADTYGGVAYVNFYHDLNNNGVLDLGTDRYLGRDSDSTDGWTWGGTVQWDRGDYFAVAYDVYGAKSTPVKGHVDQRPVVGFLTNEPNPIEVGQTVVFHTRHVITGLETAYDPDGTIVAVEFWRDADDDGAFNPLFDSLLGTDTNGADGWSIEIPVTWNPDDTPLYFARAKDNEGYYGYAAFTLNQSPRIGQLVVNNSPFPLESLLTLEAHGVTDADGYIEYVQFTGGATGLLDFFEPDSWTWSFTPEWRVVDMIMDDFDQDGLMDVAVAVDTTPNLGADFVAILRNDGLGNLQAISMARINGAGYNGPKMRIASGDFNGDGYPDIAAVNSTAYEPVIDELMFVVLNSGDGTLDQESLASYRTWKDPSAFNVPEAITVNDFNGDGILDIAVASRFYNDVGIFLGVGDGTFAIYRNYQYGLAVSGDRPADDAPEDIVSADFDNDRDIDIAVVSQNGMFYMWNDGTGNFYDPGGTMGRAWETGITGGDAQTITYGPVAYHTVGPDQIYSDLQVGGSDLDMYRVTLEMGQQLTASLTAFYPNENVKTALYIYDATGALCASSLVPGTTDQFSSSVSFRPWPGLSGTGTGNYYVVVAGKELSGFNIFTGANTPTDATSYWYSLQLTVTNTGSFYDSDEHVLVPVTDPVPVPPAYLENGTPQNVVRFWDANSDGVWSTTEEVWWDNLVANGRYDVEIRLYPGADGVWDTPDGFNIALTGVALFNDVGGRIGLMDRNEEAWIDLNCNGQYDAGEPQIWNGGDGKWDTAAGTAGIAGNLWVADLDRSGTWTNSDEVWVDSFTDLDGVYHDYWEVRLYDGGTSDDDGMPWDGDTWATWDGTPGTGGANVYVRYNDTPGVFNPNCDFVWGELGTNNKFNPFAVYDSDGALLQPADFRIYPLESRVDPHMKWLWNPVEGNSTLGFGFRGNLFFWSDDPAFNPSDPGFDPDTYFWDNTLGWNMPIWADDPSDGIPGVYDHGVDVQVWAPPGFDWTTIDGAQGIQNNLYFVDTDHDGQWDRYSGVDVFGDGSYFVDYYEVIWAEPVTFVRDFSPEHPHGYGDSIAFTEFNEDAPPENNDLDIVTANSRTGLVSVLFGDYWWNGTYAGFYPNQDRYEMADNAFTVYAGPNPTSVRIADLNLADDPRGRGFPDILTTNMGDGTVSVITGTKLGFEGYLDYVVSDYTLSGSPYNRPFEAPLATAVIDLTEDGVMDLLVADKYDVAVLTQGYPFHNSDPLALNPFQCEVPYVGASFGFSARYSVIPFDTDNGDGYMRIEYSVQAFDDDYDPWAVGEPNAWGVPDPDPAHFEYLGSSRIVKLSVPFNQLPYIWEVRTTRVPVAGGQQVTLTAVGVGDVDGSVRRVEFYLDNGDGWFNPGLDPSTEDVLLGADNNGSNDWTWTGTLPSTASLFWAVAVDDEGARGKPVGTLVNELPVTAGPNIGLYTDGRYDAADDTLIQGAVGSPVGVRSDQFGGLLMADADLNGRWSANEDIWQEGTGGGLVNGKYDWEYQILGGVGPGTPGIQGNLYFADLNGNGRYNWNEEIWADLNANGRYDDGVDLKVYSGGWAGVPDGVWSTSNGTPGIHGNLYFADSGDGLYNVGEAVWADSQAGTTGFFDPIWEVMVDWGADAQWLTEDGTAGILGNVVFENADGDAMWNPGEAIWADEVFERSDLWLVAVDVDFGPNSGGMEVRKVHFYRDSNYNGVFDPTLDYWLGRGSSMGDWLYGTNAGEDWVLYLPSMNWPVGTQTIFAVVQDEHDEWSAVATSRVYIKNIRPAIQTLSDSPDPVTEGEYITLTARGVTDPYGRVDYVAFYLESNGVPGFQGPEVSGTPDRQLGIDSDGTNGWSWTGLVDWGRGLNTYYARPLDNRQEWSVNVATTTGVVNARPFFGGLLYEMDASGGPNEYPTDTAPWSVVYGDFNSDGRFDLITANQGMPNLSVLLGNGDGTFQAPVNIPLSGVPTGMVAGDFNEDGKLDLVVTDWTNDVVWVLIGDGAGGFASSTSVFVGTDPFSVVKADFNLDGNLDVAVANLGSDNVSILLGNGAGTLTWTRDVDVGGGPAALAVADFNGDGNPDLAVSNSNDGTVTILLGNGAGNFVEEPTESPIATGVGSVPWGIVAGNFDRDNYLDLAVSLRGNGEILMLWGNGDGTFTAGMTLDLGGSEAPAMLTAAYMNSDDRLDLVATYSNDDIAAVWVNYGQRQFFAQTVVDTGSFPAGVLAADLDNNNVVDVVTADSASNQVSVFRGIGGLIDVDLYDNADLDRDGDTDWDGYINYLGDAREEFDPAYQGMTLILQATGLTDPDGDSIAQVQFWRDANGNGVFDELVDARLDPAGVSSFHTPFGDIWQWTGTVTWSIGQHTYFVRAQDNRGGWSYAVAQSGSVVNPPPVIVGGLQDTPDPVTQGYNLTLTARNVTDVNGTVQKVEFYRDSNNSGAFEADQDTLLGTTVMGVGGDFSVNTTVTWAAGTHTYFARALDNLNSWSVAASCTGLVNGRPVVESLNATPTKLRIGGTLRLEAVDTTGDGIAVYDPDGSVVKVVFYRDTNGNEVFDEGSDEVIGQDTNGADGWWIEFVAGSSAHRFFARAQDDMGGWSFAAMSPLVNRLPMVGSLADSPDPATQDGTIRLDASTVYDVDGYVDAVEFYRDVNGNGLFEEGVDKYLGEDTTSSDGWYWSDKVTWAGGMHTTYFARARDNYGDYTAAADVAWTTGYVNRCPTVGVLIDTPDPVIQGLDLTLSAQGVSDPDGAIVEVAFYRDFDADGLFTEGVDAYLGSGTLMAPGQWDLVISTAGWPIGLQTYFARARDNNDAWGPVITATGRVNGRPVIGGLQDLPDPVTEGEMLTLNALGVADADGSVIVVEFWRDADASGTWDPAIDHFLGYDVDGADGWSWTGIVGWPAGQTHRYFARARDNDGAWTSVAASTTGYVNWRPVIGGVGYIPPGPISRGYLITVEGLNVTDADVGGGVTSFTFYRSTTALVFNSASDTVVAGTPVDNNAGYSGGLGFTDADRDRLWDAGEEVWADTNGNHFYDWEYQVWDGGDGAWNTLAGTFGIQGNLYFADTDGNGRFNWYEEIWADMDGDGYYTAADIQVFAGIDGTWTTPYGLIGYHGNLRFNDTGDGLGGLPDGLWQADEEVWADANNAGTAGSYDDIREVALYDGGDSVWSTEDGTAALIGNLMYYDADTNGTPDIGEGIWAEGLTLLGAGTQSGPHWTRIEDTLTWPTGDFYLVGYAYDNMGGWINLYATGTVQNTPPEIVGGLLDAPDPLERGKGLTLTAVNPQDADGTVVLVEFYRDSNGDGMVDGGDELLGTDSDGSDGWSVTFGDGVAWHGGTTTWPLGPTQYLARAQDNNGAWSAVVTTTGEVVNGKPVIASLTVDADVIVPGTDVTLEALGVADPDLYEDVQWVEFYLDDGDGIYGAGDVLLGIDNVSGGGWSLLVPGAVTGTWPVGPVAFHALAWDNHDYSDPASVGSLVGNRPVITIFTDNPDPLPRGDALTLTVPAAGVTDPDGDTIVRVEFYLDDGDGEFDEALDTLLGADTDGLGDWKIVVPDTLAWAIGTNTYFARAQDDATTWSLPFMITGNVVNNLAEIGKFIVDPNPVGPGEAITLIASNVNDVDGAVTQVEFWRDADGNNVFNELLDERLGVDLVPDIDGNWTLFIPDTSAWPLGMQRFFARAMDDEAEWGPVVTTTVAIEYEQIACGVVNGATIIFYDVDLSNGKSNPNIAWGRAQFNANTDILVDTTPLTGQVAGIYFYGNGTRTRDIGIAVYGYRGLRTFSDTRRTVVNAPIAFLAVQGDITTATFNNGLTGMPLDGYLFNCAAAGTQWLIKNGQDLDGNAIGLSDMTGLYANGNIGTVTIKGVATGDIVTEGKIVTLRNSTQGFGGDITAWGGDIRTVTACGNIVGDIHAFGNIVTVTATGGNIMGDIIASPAPWGTNIGTVSASRAYVGGVYIGGAISGDITASGALTAVRATGGALSGNVTVGGNAGTIAVTYGGLSGNVMVGGNLTSVTVSGGNITGNINVGGTLGSVRVSALSGVGGAMNANVAVGGNLTSAVTTGDWIGNLNVGGNAGTVSVGGSLRNSNFNIGGAFTSLTTRIDLRDSVIDVGGKCSLVSVLGNFNNSSVDAGQLATVSVKGQITGVGGDDIIHATIGRFTARDFDNAATFSLGGPPQNWGGVTLSVG